MMRPNLLINMPPAAVDPAKTLKLARNWNGKMYCKFFTSIRLDDPYWTPGDYYKVVKEDYCFRGLLHDKKVIKLDELPAYTAILDTGLPLPLAKQKIMEFYPHVADWKAASICVLLIENIEFIEPY
jgi:hypothetical protein